MGRQAESPVSQELSEMQENYASAASQQGWAGERRTPEEGGSSRWAMKPSSWPPEQRMWPIWNFSETRIIYRGLRSRAD